MNIKFTITKFTVSVVKNGEVAEAKCNGERLSGKALGFIKGLKKGQKIYIENVYAKGPKGSPKDTFYDLKGHITNNLAGVKC